MYFCNLCGQANLLPLIDFGQHPIAHHFLNNPAQTEFIHPVDLRFCDDCGLVQLVDPVSPDKFYTNYVTLSSWKHQPHIPHTVELINELPGIDRSSRIIEVGSNDGTFCRALLDNGYTQVLGVEPSLDGQEASRIKGVKTCGGYFTPGLARELASQYGRCQMFVARQVLEHISDLRGFQEALRLLLAPDGFALIEVPDFATDMELWDYSLWEEHVNYFTLDLINRFLAESGVETRFSESIRFSGESLIVVGQNTGQPSRPAEPKYLAALRAQVRAYRDRWPVFKKELVDFLANLQRKGGRIAVYGAGARLCSLVNYTGIAPYIEFIVDDQPEKQGKYMPGSRLPILSSDALEQHSIDLCLLAVNTESEERAIRRHYAWQENGGCFYSVLPPSDRLLPVWDLVRTGRG